MSIKLQRFADNLKRLRKERGLSQKQLANGAGVPLYMIVVCERAKDYRGVEHILKLARFLNVLTQVLLCGE